ncbi:nucleotidyltransferase domain-containing protein [Candidatus Babeliales bacterium]|nr:nucleotidyltransferase domain-containing protein [Candidatus Babeliales bacterium]
MEILVKMKWGSHLFGTATPTSDVDIKGIYLPSARDILLQQIKPVVLEQRAKKVGEKNLPSDVDYELYSPEKYLMLLAQGQSVALEMLFTPDSALLQEPLPAWDEIKKLAPRILTKKSASFVGYCRQQANKYCLKGARLGAARRVLEVLVQAEKQHGSSAPLRLIRDMLQSLVADNDFLALGGDRPDLEYFEVTNKRALLNASIKSARQMVEKIIEEYGERATMAEHCDGADWKALSHAVRVGLQALEFLRDHTITFPLKRAEHIVAIKQGKVPFAQVVQEIEQLVVDVEVAAQNSKLPETCDQKIIDDFIEQLYLEQIKKHYFT